MRRFLAGLTLAAAIPALAGAVELTPNPDGPPVDNRTPEQIEADRLARFKLTPINQIVKEGRNLRRVTFRDIQDSKYAPTVTFEKMPDGHVQMTVVSNDANQIDRAELKPEAWAYLTQSDAFALPRQKPLGKPTEICHGNAAVVEAAEGRKTARYDAAVCNGPADIPVIVYTRRFSRVAVDSIPRCAPYREFARETTWTLVECLRNTAPGESERQNQYAAGEGPIGDVTDFVIKTTTEYTGPKNVARPREGY